MNLRRAFALALKASRSAHNLTQEDFGVVSSRTYMSTLERGLKSPTLDKLDDIAAVLGVHPAALILASYAISAGAKDAEKTINQVLSETRHLLKLLPIDV